MGIDEPSLTSFATPTFVSRFGPPPARNQDFGPPLFLLETGESNRVFGKAERAPFLVKNIARAHRVS